MGGGGGVALRGEGRRETRAPPAHLNHLKKVKYDCTCKLISLSKKTLKQLLIVSAVHSKKQQQLNATKPLETRVISKEITTPRQITLENIPYFPTNHMHFRSVFKPLNFKIE